MARQYNCRLRAKRQVRTSNPRGQMSKHPTYRKRNVNLAIFLATRKNLIPTPSGNLKHCYCTKAKTTRHYNYTSSNLIPPYHAIIAWFYLISLSLAQNNKASKLIQQSTSLVEARTAYVDNKASQRRRFQKPVKIPQDYDRSQSLSDYLKHF